MACSLQTLIVNACNKPDIKGVELAHLTRAWEQLEERKRKLRMAPLPKAVDVSKDKHRRVRMDTPSFE